MKTIEDYKTFLSQVREETGIKAMVADDAGLVTVSIDEAYNLNLQFVQATGKVLCFVEVVELSKDTPKAVYRDLLIGGLFGKDTAGGYFALEDETETVVYNFFFDLEDVSNDIDEFVSTLEKILQLCDMWRSRIQTMMTETTDTNKDDTSYNSLSNDEASHFVIHP